MNWDIFGIRRRREERRAIVARAVATAKREAVERARRHAEAAERLRAEAERRIARGDVSLGRAIRGRASARDVIRHANPTPRRRDHGSFAIKSPWFTDGDLSGDRDSSSSSYSCGGGE